MSDLNDIFGYKVYKPPPEKNLPIIADLNVYGEVVTLIDPNADVIKDPAVQRIFKSLDGERTVKIEDLPPDVRYDGWNKKAQYDKQIIVNNSGNRTNLQPQLPYVNQNLLRENENSQEYHQEALRQAQQKAISAKNSELEFSRQLQETRIALEKEISKQLIEQLTIRAQKQSVTPEQQALIEKLYLDLRLINPDLAFGILKTFSNIENSPSNISSPAPSSIKQPSRVPSVVQQMMTCPSGGCPYAVSSRAVTSQQAARTVIQAPVPQPRANVISKPSSSRPTTVDDVRAARIRASRR